MDKIKSLVFGFVRKWVEGEVSNMVPGLEQRIIEVLVKSEPFKSNPDQARAVATDVLSAVQSEITVLIQNM